MVGTEREVEENVRYEECVCYYRFQEFMQPIRSQTRELFIL